MAVTRSATPVIAYRNMHNLCCINIERRRKAVKIAKSKYFEAERVIERRGGRDTVFLKFHNMKSDSDVFRSRLNPAFRLKKGKVDITPERVK